MCHTSLVLALFMSMSLSVSAQKGCKVIHFREWWSYRNEYHVRGPQIVWISTYFMYNIPKYLPANIYVTYCRTIMGISCMHNFKQQVVGTRQQEHIIWRKENLHTDYVEQNIPYNLCNKIITTVFRFFFLLFQKIRKGTGEQKIEKIEEKTFFPQSVCLHRTISLKSLLQLFRGGDLSDIICECHISRTVF